MNGKKLSTESPGDGSIFNSIGELHLKRQATNDAVAAFLQAANAFRAEGATLKAIATFKKVLKLDPAGMTRPAPRRPQCRTWSAE